MIRTLPANATNEDIKQLVVEWSERLAQKQFADAVAMFEYELPGLTPAELELWISNYGSPVPNPDGRTYELTSLLALDTADDIIANSIDVDRENLFGLDPDRYLGMVHYDDVPLDGAPSDLTARFNIKQVGDDKLTLEFVDLHVM